MPGGGQDGQRVEIGDGVVDAINQRSRPLRAAVASVVDGVDGEPLRDQPRGHVGVAAAVLARAVGHHHDGARLRVRKPRPPIDAARRRRR